MSTLRVSNIQDTSGGNTSTPAAIANGIAKAWVNFNGTGTVAIQASYNVSSITDNGVGQYVANFTTAMADTGYSAVASSNAASQIVTTGGFASSGAVGVSTGSVDPSRVSLAIFR